MYASNSSDFDGCCSLGFAACSNKPSGPKLRPPTRTRAHRVPVPARRRGGGEEGAAAPVLSPVSLQSGSSTLTRTAAEIKGRTCGRRSARPLSGLNATVRVRARGSHRRAWFGEYNTGWVKACPAYRRAPAARRPPNAALHLSYGLERPGPPAGNEALVPERRV